MVEEPQEEREITAKINTAEIQKAWEERAEKARGITLSTIIGARTDLGRVRENNEDKFEFYQPEDEDVLAQKGALYAVADGMGGHASGQIASEMALKTIIGTYYSDDSPMVEQSLRTAMQTANALIFDAARAIPDRNGMGTTGTVLVVRGEEAFIANVGDSRCYRLRGGKLEQISEDHSWVNEQIKRGGLTPEEAAYSPFKNVITRCLGNSPSVEVDIFTEKLEEGDVFLLCSDGLTGEVADDDIKNTLKGTAPSEAAWKLVDRALENGGRDNCTVLILAVRDIIKKGKKKGFAGFLGRD